MPQIPTYIHQYVCMRRPSYWSLMPHVHCTYGAAYTLHCTTLHPQSCPSYHSISHTICHPFWVTPHSSDLHSHSVIHPSLPGPPVPCHPCCPSSGLTITHPTAVI